jgi:hypothetical protein
MTIGKLAMSKLVRREEGHRVRTEYDPGTDSEAAEDDGNGNDLGNRKQTSLVDFDDCGSMETGQYGQHGLYCRRRSLRQAC